jgi:hypothetical protein
MRYSALVLLVLAARAWAQLAPGVTELRAYDIKFGDTVIGKVVVVGDPASLPSGYSAETEYWTWASGQAWRGAFRLVPTDTVPSYSAHSWQTFPHDHFDLSGTVSIPSIDPDPGDAFYEVSIKSGSSWLDRGYMWLVDGAPDEQVWYGQGLTSDLVGDGGTEIRFQSVEPPAAGSEQVYLLQ